MLFPSTQAKMGVWGALTLLFITTVTITIVSYLFPSEQGIVGFFTRYHFEAMLGIALGGILIGALSFRVFTQELKTTTHTLHHNTQLMLSLLAPEEKACVEYIMHHHGEAFQHDLARLPGMNRLKAHRVVRKLSDRGIVDVQNHGKANRVKLLAGLYESPN